MSQKVMASSAISWYGVTKALLVNKNGIKVNKEKYCRYLRKELFLATEKVRMIGYLLKIERHLIDPTLCKIF